MAVPTTAGECAGAARVAADCEGARQPTGAEVRWELRGPGGTWRRFPGRASCRCGLEEGRGRRELRTTRGSEPRGARRRRWVLRI